MDIKFNEGFYHKPILLMEAVDGLSIRPEGVYVDATLGGGGHSFEIASRLDGGGQLFCIDQDDEALEAAGKRLSGFGCVRFLKGNFREMEQLLKEQGIEEIDGALFDLGVSSPQLDRDYRGFSYMQDARLDMRMDAGASLTAYDLVNQAPKEELSRIFFEYGEERYSRQIAAAIALKRESAPIVTTLELAGVIKSAVPGGGRYEDQHPAKRCFQALRIAVNDELAAASEGVLAAVRLLKSGGRICVITFHSLEDRIVKDIFKGAQNPCTCPPDFPVCICQRKATLKLITKKPIEASKEELGENPRSRSAKLRIAEKL